MSQDEIVPARYVVLHHTDVAVPHFDLMIEVVAGDNLWTWRLSAWPLASGDLIERVADHRAMYLEYEGPISGGRGLVARIASGNCEIQTKFQQLCIRVGGTFITLPTTMS